MFSDETGSTKCKCNRPGWQAKGNCSTGEVMCNPGKFSDKCSGCQKCPAGTYGVPPQSSPCPCCKPGSISKAGAAKCICCPENTIANNESCATTCKPCDDG